MTSGLLTSPPSVVIDETRLGGAHALRGLQPADEQETS